MFLTNIISFTPLSIVLNIVLYDLKAHKDLINILDCNSFQPK